MNTDHNRRFYFFATDGTDLHRLIGVGVLIFLTGLLQDKGNGGKKISAGLRISTDLEPAYVEILLQWDYMYVQE